MKDGGPVFPKQETIDNAYYGGKHDSSGPMGISMRDYFAAKAMQAIISGVWISGHSVERLPTDRECAERAWKYADEMLKAREES